MSDARGQVCIIDQAGNRICSSEGPKPAGGPAYTIKFTAVGKEPAKCCDSALPPNSPKAARYGELFAHAEIHGHHPVGGWTTDEDLIAHAKLILAGK